MQSSKKLDLSTENLEALRPFFVVAVEALPPIGDFVSVAEYALALLDEVLSLRAAQCGKEL